MVLFYSTEGYIEIVSYFILPAKHLDTILMFSIFIAYIVFACKLSLVEINGYVPSHIDVVINLTLVSLQYDLLYICQCADLQNLQNALEWRMLTDIMPPVRCLQRCLLPSPYTQLMTTGDKHSLSLM